MRHLYSTILFVFSCFILTAQTQPPRYITMELFTNTPCPSCVAQNPGFFSLIANYPNSVHQVSFYPGSPYSSCPLYQGNTSENLAHRQRRALTGTPRVYFNGQDPLRSGQVSAETIENLLNQTSIIHVGVTETNTSAEITVTPYDNPGIAQGKLYAMLVESDVKLQDVSPSWEDEHFNVFRKFIINGTDIDLLQGATESVSFTYDQDWDAAKMYVLAWVEDAETEEVLNSGTRFDPAFSSTTSVAISDDITISPNPFEAVFHLNLGNQSVQRIEAINGQGKLVQEIAPDAKTIDASNWANGIYYIVVYTTDGAKGVKRLVKQ